MAFDADDEILQDFLVEAGEILESLQEQLVELEQRPDDDDLLHSVFRGFHTIKGGASFVGLTPLVELCHRSEDVFNIVRNHERPVDSELMDVILRALDILNDMFETVRGGEMPESADPELLSKLEELAQPAGSGGGEAASSSGEASSSDEAGSGGAETAASAAGADSSEAAAAEGGKQAGGGEDITDAEFETLLDAIDEGGTSQSGSSGSDEDISEEEFEALLDQLHGQGKHQGVPEAEEKTQEEAGAGESSSGSDEEIDEEEFEELLDQLYGDGKAPGVDGAPPAVEGAEGASGEAESAAPAAEQSGPAAGSAESGQPAETSKSEGAAKPAQGGKGGDHGGGDGGKGGDAGKKAGGDGHQQQGETTVRVDTQRLDEIMNMVGELVLVRNRLVNLEAKLGNGEITSVVSNLDVVTGDLQQSVMKTRMQPVKKVFGRFPRVIRDLSRSLEKEINLEMEGEETDLDKNLVEALSDPLVHLVRNSVDHGIEPPDERERIGKPRAGTVKLSAQQEGDHILLSITDDGAGMDADKLRRKAVEKELMDTEAANRLDDKEAYNLIFHPGFSTKTEISDVSGRGVGMDVVKTKIAQLNGSVDIDSALGEGTRINVKVPLTLAIIPTLMIVVGNQTFALPLVNVSEIFDLNLEETNVVDGQQVVMVREHAMPLFYLSEWLVDESGRKAKSEEGDGESHVVVVQVGSQKLGFVVDSLIGQEEVVIKPLGALLEHVDGLAGATITGDGRIALILDVPGLLKRYARRVRFQH
ncbi:two-component system, chemotaxis family, sensor kinase CheA [Thiohalospira halophila DSM 15071]|uniref:Chemotaxis protein CheA n=1 Tax=Thiohalospira halophila DSM 15071 TaxID=1123397 RepID=A0A1I1PLD1_9GAMM|nr:chemotaxis protein CheA [Thiohalospira halophila]SFD08488.1 two-component system, chemotaxis family, sensor kinase CheA [Thiohalospira halophila DSM 15071]